MGVKHPKGQRRCWQLPKERGRKKEGTLRRRGWEPWNLIVVGSAFDMRSPVTLKQKVQYGLLPGLGRISDLVEVMALKGGSAGTGIKFNEFLGLGKYRSGKKKFLLLKL